MKKCHDWYLLNRGENKINVTKVLELINKEDTLSLYKMIRRYQINHLNDKQDNTSERVEYPHSRVTYDNNNNRQITMDMFVDTSVL